MKIINITAFEVIVPAHPGVINSEGLNKPLHKLPVGAKGGWSVQFDQVPKLIIKMTLDNGIVGWGELYRAHNWQMVEDISQLLIGVDLRDLSLQKLPFAFCREYDGFECAIYDAYARSIGVRVVDLLGGPVKEQIKVGACQAIVMSMILESWLKDLPSKVTIALNSNVIWMMMLQHGPMKLTNMRPV